MKNTPPKLVIPAPVGHGVSKHPWKQTPWLHNGERSFPISGDNLSLVIFDSADAGHVKLLLTLLGVKASKLLV